MKKEFDAVKMVRDIRDKIYEETKNMSTKELINYYRSGAKAFHAKLGRRKAVQTR